MDIHQVNVSRYMETKSRFNSHNIKKLIKGRKAQPNLFERRRGYLFRIGTIADSSKLTLTEPKTKEGTGLAETPLLKIP